jgi:hypothetical protein
MTNANIHMSNILWRCWHQKLFLPLIIQPLLNEVFSCNERIACTVVLILISGNPGKFYAIANEIGVISIDSLCVWHAREMTQKIQDVFYTHFLSFLICSWWQELLLCFQLIVFTNHLWASLCFWVAAFHITMDMSIIIIHFPRLSELNHFINSILWHTCHSS